ncbi:hypothetical protein ElyMa_007016600 [Elysia marginata]|uniref:Uncharacterized protein n=1 Tax=Elysia marginata TaxID=1093978 RepID=A0AAV4JQG2_9GAST|nr:hypothetical protein ElyMa_007016600 [Elysia marginata]
MGSSDRRSRCWSPATQLVIMWVRCRRVPLRWRVDPTSTVVGAVHGGPIGENLDGWSRKLIDCPFSYLFLNFKRRCFADWFAKVRSGDEGRWYRPWTDSASRDECFTRGVAEVGFDGLFVSFFSPACEGPQALYSMCFGGRA